MKARKHIWALLPMLAAVGIFGCHRNIVKASPSIAPPPVQPLSAPERPVTTARTAPEPPPEVESSAPTVPAMNPAPAPPRPATPESEVSKPKPEPPQISPQLSPRQQADAERTTKGDILTAEKNLQLAEGKPLNASQNDLAEKTRESLSRAHEAMQANDWLRAQDLAQKAAILSNELLKSL